MVVILIICILAAVAIGLMQIRIDRYPAFIIKKVAVEDGDIFMPRRQLETLQIKVLN
jgi:hypothetical protein